MRQTNIARRAAALAAGMFLVIGGFQLLLALGVPWGKAAWGGAEENLTPAQRIASSFSVLVYVGAALVVLGRTGHWGARYAGIFRIGAWLLAGLMLAGAMLNAASSSAWERFMWAPFALMLAVLCFFVARSDESPSSLPLP